MGSERLYIVRTAAGEEFGPLDQEALVKYAENGKIAYNDKIRSTLIPQWEQAVNLSFLKDILRDQQEKEVMKNERGLLPWLKRRLTLEVEELKSDNAKLLPSSFPRASFPLRLSAAIIDLVIVAVGCLLILGFCYMLLKMNIVGHGSVVYVLALLGWLWCLLYYTVLLVTRTQTIGQRYFGIYVVRNRKKGGQLYISRCFFYTLTMYLLGIFTPLFMFVAGRSFQELLTNTRVVRLVGKPSR